jgi:hypothetical protein
MLGNTYAHLFIVINAACKLHHFRNRTRRTVHTFSLLQAKQAQEYCYYFKVIQLHGCCTDRAPIRIHVYKDLACKHMYVLILPCCPVYNNHCCRMRVGPPTSHQNPHSRQVTLQCISPHTGTSIKFHTPNRCHFSSQTAVYLLSFRFLPHTSHRHPLCRQTTLATIVPYRNLNITMFTI